MYGCESWTFWRRLSAEELMLLNCGVGEDLRVPWTARRSNQSILKEISPGISLEGMMLKLKLQYFGNLMRRVDSLEKTLMLGGIGGRRRRGRQRMRWLDGITDSMDWVWVNSGSWWWTGRPGVLGFMGSQRVGHNWVTDLIWSNHYNWPLNHEGIKDTECVSSKICINFDFLKTELLIAYCWPEALPITQTVNMFFYVICIAYSVFTVK